MVFINMFLITYLSKLLSDLFLSKSKNVKLEFRHVNANRGNFIIVYHFCML